MWVSAITEILTFWTTVTDIGMLIGYIIGNCMIFGDLLLAPRPTGQNDFDYQDITVTLPVPAPYGPRSLILAIIVVSVVYAVIDAVIVFIVAAKAERFTASHYTALIVLELLMFAVHITLGVALMIRLVNEAHQRFPSRTYNKCVESVGNTLHFSYLTHCDSMPEKEAACYYIISWCNASISSLELGVSFTAILVLWDSVAFGVMGVLLCCYKQPDTNSALENRKFRRPTFDFSMPIQIQIAGRGDAEMDTVFSNHHRFLQEGAYLAAYRYYSAKHSPPPSARVSSSADPEEKREFGRPLTKTPLEGQPLAQPPLQHPLSMPSSPRQDAVAAASMDPMNHSGPATTAIE